MLGIFLDIETTGLNPLKHRAIDIAYKIIDLMNGEEKETFHATLYQPQKIWDQKDPQSIQVNQFSYEEIEKGLNESEVKKKIIASFQQNAIQRGSSVFICQNPSFDRVFFSQIIDPDTQEFLNWPYHWLDLASMHWQKEVSNYPSSNTILSEKELSKDAIASFYHLPKEDKVHRALNGVRHLIKCYEKVVGFPCKQSEDKNG